MKNFYIAWTVALLSCALLACGTSSDEPTAQNALGSNSGTTGGECEMDKECVRAVAGKSGYFDKAKVFCTATPMERAERYCAECLTDADCLVGLCIRDQCNNSCRSDEECQADYGGAGIFQNDSNLTCANLDLPSAPGICSECSSNDDCVDGYTCLSSALCVLAEENLITECLTSDDCTQGYSCGGARLCVPKVTDDSE